MPPSLAAGILALVLKHAGYRDIPNERIASVCGVSEGTLSKCLKKLEGAVKKGLLALSPTLEKELADS
jgi:DNA-binding Lrp family transcriptional regulator